MSRSASAAGDPFLWPALGTAVLFVSTVGVLLATVIGVSGRPGGATAVSHAGSVPVAGAGVYRTACAVCHGPDGAGIVGLGRPLRESAFVREQSDGALFELIANGRAPSDPANTSGVLMPARGAQNLSDEKIGEVVAYLRSMQTPGAPAVSTASWDRAGGGAAGGGAVELTEHAGYGLFVASCAACHGQGGEGMEGLGLPLTTSGFVRGAEDDGLVSFIKTGRPMWDANNVTGLDMPPKGGNPAITDDDLRLIVEYLRAVQARAIGA